MAIYTRTGDRGTTSLLGGKMVRKDDRRIAAIGAVDEANSAIGVARGFCLDRETDSVLARIQSDLFYIGAQLANPLEGEGSKALPEGCVEFLEKGIDDAQKPLPRLSSFVVPAGSRLAAHLFFARAVARRAEREAVALAGCAKISPLALGYLNRLSDLLFVLARKANAASGFGDAPWKPQGRAEGDAKGLP